MPILPLHAIMPDHFHGMVFITEAGAADLDDVVCYFAAESERLAGRPLWDGAWRDSICLAKGQLARQNHYVLDNPRRLWIRRQHPDLFRKVLGFRHGRLFDLTEEEAGADAPAIWSVATGEAVNGPRRSNRVTKAFTLDLPRTFIKEAALAAGGSVIQLVTEGFGQYYKAAGRDFDCCAAGRMLQLTPFSPAVTGHGRDRLGKERLEWLNAAAHAISDFALGWART